MRSGDVTDHREQLLQSTGEAGLHYPVTKTFINDQPVHSQLRLLMLSTIDLPWCNGDWYIALTTATCEFTGGLIKVSNRGNEVRLLL